MVYRVFGKTGWRVSQVGLGCWQFGGPIMLDGKPDGWSGVNDEESVATVKRAVDGVVVETLPRHELVAVQTPQAFVGSVLRAAFSSSDNSLATDCASLVEAAGGRVKVVAGDERLQKVTTRADLERVSGWLDG